MIGVLTCVEEPLQPLLTQPLRVSVREVVSALQRGRGPAQSHSQVLLPGLPGLETLRAHAQVRSCTGRPEKLDTNKHPSVSLVFFCFFLSRFVCRRHRAAVTPVQSSSLCASAAVGQRTNRSGRTPPHTHTLIISVSADLIKRLKASDVFGFAFHDERQNSDTARTVGLFDGRVTTHRPVSRHSSLV